MNENVSAYLSAVDGLPEVVERLRRVQVCNQSATSFLLQYDSPETLFYLDPPYLPETRAAGAKEYGAYEMTSKQHFQLLNCLTSLSGKWVLSGYPSKMYSEWAVFYGYKREEIRIPNSASSAKVKEIKTEILWSNF
jgi:DNA adenine methylase